ncbi:MAG: hypothetical protein ACOYOJ_00655 [Alsobacter sp.]
MLTAVTLPDLDRATELLAEGFPARTRAFWRTSLARLVQAGGNSAAEYPLGFFLMENDEPVGVALTPASLRQRPGSEPQRVVNVSSLYVRPAHRWRAALMLRKIVSEPGLIYTDLSPTADVRTMIATFGFKAVNLGVVMHVLPALALCRGRPATVSEWQAGEPLPAGSPPATLIESHRALGCLPLIVDGKAGRTLLVMRPKRVRRLPATQAVYVGSHAALEPHLPTLARHLLGRGLLVAQIDCRSEAGTRNIGFRRNGLWFAKGSLFEDCTDHLGTELSLFDL